MCEIGKGMRKVTLFNDKWKFIQPGKETTEINLPHTWNAVDGQDGGDDYYRGTCVYTKTFSCAFQEEEEVYLEFRGVSNSAEVLLNGHSLCKHDGGYSSFRVNLTGFLKEENCLQVKVDNSENDKVYPQKADFTFYGGIYRDVYLIIVPKSHFLLDYYGGNGIKVSAIPLKDTSDYKVICEFWAEEAEGEKVSVQIAGAGHDEAVISNGRARMEMIIKDAHLWDGIRDPYLYEMKAVLGEDLDEVMMRFGCRTVEIDAQKGFYLNGREYPLRGVSRHQDREGCGNAITLEMMQEDIEVIKEIGANSVRVAHYQQAQEFYDLLDENGLLCWAEIPYITKHMENGNENTVSQMKELIVQNYHHPSIYCWALSNEITAASKPNDPDMLKNHQNLQKLCKKMDSCRHTAMAHAFMLEPENEMCDVSDVNAYNLYYGWYMGELGENEEFFDEYHRKFPQKPIGFSEFGADANPAFHSAAPAKGDYTEEYQCIYHEHILQMLKSRPWIWCAYVWNLFDFAADGRAEGGNSGKNQKGLICFDHKQKKDAFYAYKAHWSNEPFVHLCGKRFINRTGDTQKIKVYTNLPEVFLYVNGNLFATQTENHVMEFEIPFTGDTVIEAKAGEFCDAMKLHKVEKEDENYILAGAVVHNWFEHADITVISGYYSIKDTIGEIRMNPDGNRLMDELLDKARASRGKVAQSTKDNPVLNKMLNKQRFESLMRQAGEHVFPEDEVVRINKLLNQIPRIQKG